MAVYNCKSTRNGEPVEYTGPPLGEGNTHSTGSGMWGKEFNDDIEDALIHAKELIVIESRGKNLTLQDDALIVLAKAVESFRLEYETICSVCGRFGDNEFGEWAYGEFCCSWDCFTGKTKKIKEKENGIC